MPLPDHGPGAARERPDAPSVRRTEPGERRKAPDARLPRLHLIAADGLIGAPDFRERLGPVLAAGGSALAVHLRARATSTRILLGAASWLAGAARETGALAIVNDRLDVALAAAAHGVHLREDSLPAKAVRAVEAASRPAPAPLLVGRSIHTPQQARALAPCHDYLVLGAVFRTRSHPERPPIGLDALEAAAQNSTVPVLAIGGVTPSAVPQVCARGAYGVVVLSGVWRARAADRSAGAAPRAAATPAEAVKRYLEALP